VQAAEYVVTQGDRALLHDLTHCLRIGDLSFVKDGFPPVVAECETRRRHSSEHGRRKARQHQRLELVRKVLGESVEKSDAEDLFRYSMPAGFIEQDRQFSYHIRAFEEASRIGPRGYTIVRPEEGLVYIATAPDCPSTEFMPDFVSTVRPCRCDLAALRKRVEGAFPWVPPVTLLPIDEDTMVRYLDQEFNFYVYLDLDHVVRQLEQRGSQLRPTFDVAGAPPQRESRDQFSGWFMFEADSGNEWRVCVGPKLLHRVLFGLATLESAVTALAQAGTGAADVASKASLLSE
jgi:hypothetical protein